MPRSAALMVPFVLWASFIPTAAAVELREPRTDFRIDVAAPGGTVCMAIPPELRDSGCDGLDEQVLSGLLAARQPGQVGTAIIRFAEWNAMVMVATSDATVEAAEGSTHKWPGSRKAWRRGAPRTSEARPGAATT